MVYLIVGYGEVGKALHEIIGEAEIYDIKNVPRIFLKPDVVHICIPYTRKFERFVRYWQKTDALIIVHSSVPVGTCDKLGVVHSPIRGVHPNLAEGIRTFPKYFGGKNAGKAAAIFDKLGIKTLTYSNAKTTEALKLWDTTQFGRLIMLEKEIYKWCQKNEVDFDAVYTFANQDYNEGYVKLGRPEVVRPYLKHVEGKIGGHCVRENAKLLKVKL